MLKNYFKLALRNLARNKFISILNILGLSLAVGASFVVFTYVYFEFSADRFHKNRANIYLIENVIERSGTEQLWGDTPLPIGAFLRQDYPQLKRVVRVRDKDNIFKFNDKVFNEYTRFVDPEFMEMFTFPVKYGDPAALYDKSRIIISSHLAEKYFGDRNPVGEQVTLIYEGMKSKSFIVGAVAEKFPHTASFTFSILANWQNYPEIFEKEDLADWSKFTNATFIELSNQEDLASVEAGLSKYIRLQNASSTDWPVKRLPLQPLTTLSLHSYRINGDISQGDEPTSRIALTAIALFIIIIACFNFMNISIVSATRRLKEIGLRKSIGGVRSQLILQFLLENTVLTVLALIFGTFIGRFLFVPWLENQFDIEIAFRFSDTLLIWVFYLFMLIFLGLLSGSYPAFYISSFKPIDIFSGRMKITGKNRFTRVFLTFQFMLSIIAIVSGIVFLQNVKFTNDREWGYAKDQRYAIAVPDGATFRLLKNEIEQSPNVLSVTGGRDHLGKSGSLVVIDKLNEKTEVRRLDVGGNYIPTMGITVLEGRNFNRDLKTDEHSVIVNETFAETLGWQQILGNTFRYDSTEYTIIGIVKDFHYFNFWNKIEPVIIRMVPDDEFHYLVANIAGGTAIETAAYFESLWKNNIPDLPYNGFFQDTVFDNYFNSISGHSKLIGFPAIMAILLSSLGLFGLVSLNLAAKKKDFSIRKVLGANVGTMVRLVNKQYIGLLIIATFIGAPVSYYLMKGFLDTVYTYHVPVYWFTVALGIIVIFIVALVTVSSLIIRVLKDNPVEALRTE